VRAGIKIPKASAANEHTEAHALNTLGDDFYVRVCVRACVCVCDARTCLPDHLHCSVTSLKLPLYKTLQYTIF